jgi:hypothetical protein
MIEDRLQMREIRSHVLFIPATPWILLHLPFSDVLLYALCPMPFLLATRLGSLQAESAIDEQDLTGNEIGIIGCHE